MIEPTPSDSIVADLFSNVIFKSGAVFHFKAVNNEVVTTYEIPGFTRKIVTIGVVCTEKGKPEAKLSQSVKITYQNAPRSSASAGVVIAHGVQSYGVAVNKTGVANGQVTSQNTVVVSGSPSIQFIPFGFYNLRYLGSRQRNFNLQAGLGLNPNLSSARLEGFFSPLAISFHDAFFSPGIHVGQHENLAGGFVVGDILPSGMTKVPTKWATYAGFGFSVSYNLHPLVKAASK